jgi:hypothetical protein
MKSPNLSNFRAIKACDQETAMETFLAGTGEPKRYGLKWWARALFLFLAVLGIGMGTFTFYLAMSNPSGTSPKLWLVIVAELLLGLYFALSAFYYFLTLGYESVSMGGFLRTRTLRLDAVQGRRRISNRYGSYLVIVGKNPEDKRLMISNYFDLDDNWSTWVQSLVDLDEQDRQTALDAIASSEELGATPEARLQTLKQAKKNALVLTGIAIAAGAPLWIFHESMGRSVFGVLDLLLIALPWVVLWMAARQPLLYSVLGSKRDPRATLLFVLLASAICLMASPFENVKTADTLTLFLYGSVPGLILCIALYRMSPRTAKPLGTFLSLLFIACLYGNGLVMQINTQLDSSAPHRYSTQVLRKSISSGKSTSYDLLLNSWEPIGSEERVSVSKSLYQSVEVDDQVCITAREGTLHVGWYTVDRCN